MKNISVLGSTGSIGVSTLDVIARNPDRFKVIALTAQKNIDLLFQQCTQFHPQYAVLQSEIAAAELRTRLQSTFHDVEVLSGDEALEQVAGLSDVNIVMAAIVGAAGLLPTLAAVRAGKRVLLANKEALVMAGSLFIEEVQRHGAELLPIDSEHNAIFQCLPHDFEIGKKYSGIKKITLTASGGAFRDFPLSQLNDVTPAQACTHPNWNMGRKITVDCATMMNKGLEVIEAHWLFGSATEQIQVVLHPQSTVHSLVEYIDGSMLAQLGNPDMKTPIAHALAWPKRIQSGVESLDLLALSRLDFLPLDLIRFPCLNLAYQTLAAGGTASTILNAANEVAVQAFLDGLIRFTDIANICAKVLDEIASVPAANIEAILVADKTARQAAYSSISSPVLMV